jgi:probable phosphoglycerate mutase
LEIRPDQQLREIYAGEWEGVRFDALLEKYPVEFGEIWKNDCGRAHPENGESVLELARRIYAETERIAKAHRGECVAIFSHATPIRLLCAQWQGFPPEEASKVQFCSNASVSVVDYEDDGTYTVHLCGYDEHQGELATRFKKGSV